MDAPWPSPKGWELGSIYDREALVQFDTLFPPTDFGGLDDFDFPGAHDNDCNPSPISRQVTVSSEQASNFSSADSGYESICGVEGESLGDAANNLHASDGAEDRHRLSFTASPLSPLMDAQFGKVEKCDDIPSPQTALDPDRTPKTVRDSSESTERIASPSTGSPKRKKAARGVIVCKECSKQFHRLCDLNRHERAHSRPFKCKETSCRFSTFGFPSEKERDRHFNDKHSENPLNYPCFFPLCSYTSKRKSNCMAHMEKIHGWTYKRSKGQQATAGPHLAPYNQSSPGPTTLATPELPELFLRSPSLGTATEPDETACATNESNDNSPAYLPWESPVTRCSQIEELVNRIDTILNPTESKSRCASDPTSVVQQDNSWENEPQDRVYDSIECPETGTREIIVVDSHGLEHDSDYHDYHPLTTQQPLEADASPRNPTLGGSHGSSEFQQASSTNKSSRTKLSWSRIQKRCRNEDDDPDDDEQQDKRMKPSPPDTDLDRGLPCIYRIALPTVYNITNGPVYGSCYTKHKSISGLLYVIFKPPVNP